MNNQIKALLFTFFLVQQSHANPHQKTHKEKHEDHESLDPHEQHESDDHDHQKSLNEEKHGDHEHSEEGHGSEHEEENSPNVGPEKAVTFASEKLGIKLSDVATKNIGIEVSKISQHGDYFSVPLSAFIFNKDKVGIYRKRDSLYKLIEVQLKKEGGQSLIKPQNPSDLSPGEEIVINGVGLLRIAELQSFGASGHGHAH